MNERKNGGEKSRVSFPRDTPKMRKSAKARVLDSSAVESARSVTRRSIMQRTESRRIIKYVTLTDCATDERIEGNPSRGFGRAGSLPRLVGRSVGRTRRTQDAGRSLRRTKMEDADRGNVGLAPSGHDGAPIVPIAY